MVIAAQCCFQAKKYFTLHTDEERPDLEDDKFLFNWDDLFWGGTVVLATAPEVGRCS